MLKTRKSKSLKAYFKRRTRRKTVKHLTRIFADKSKKLFLFWLASKNKKHFQFVQEHKDKAEKSVKAGKAVRGS